jgi:hypothetical protein
MPDSNNRHKRVFRAFRIEDAVRGTREMST